MEADFWNELVGQFIAPIGEAPIMISLTSGIARCSVTRMNDDLDLLH